MLEELNDVKGARAGYEQAAALDRAYAEPLASLAWLAAQNGDAAEARALGQRAAALAPANVLARMALASADMHERQLDAASRRLEALRQDAQLSATNRSIVLGLIGDLQDAAASPAEAFEAYRASNDEMRRLHAPTYEAPDKETALAAARGRGSGAAFHGPGSAAANQAPIRRAAASAVSLSGAS